MQPRSLGELHDRAIVAILIYTASRAGAVASLKRGSFYTAGNSRMLHFDANTEKFTGDEEANRLLRRQYRAGYVVPEKI